MSWFMVFLRTSDSYCISKTFTKNTIRRSTSFPKWKSHQSLRSIFLIKITIRMMMRETRVSKRKYNPSKIRSKWGWEAKDYKRARTSSQSIKKMLRKEKKVLRVIFFTPTNLLLGIETVRTKKSTTKEWDLKMLSKAIRLWGNTSKLTIIIIFRGILRARLTFWMIDSTRPILRVSRNLACCCLRITKKGQREELVRRLWKVKRALWILPRNK